MLSTSEDKIPMWLDETDEDFVIRTTKMKLRLIIWKEASQYNIPFNFVV